MKEPEIIKHPKYGCTEYLFDIDENTLLKDITDNFPLFSCGFLGNGADVIYDDFGRPSKLSIIVWTKVQPDETN